MATLKRPGVFLEERPPLTIPPAGTLSTSTGAFLGAANRGPTTPVLCQNFADFQRYFGDVTQNSTELAFQVYSFFANGGGRCYVGRVPGSGAVAATRTLTDRAGTPVATLVVNAANAGTWGNDIYVDVTDTGGSGTPATAFDIIVRSGGTTDSFVVERFFNLNMTTTSERYAPAVVNDASLYIRLAQPATPSATAAPNNLPAVQALRQLTGGTDGSAVTSADYGNALPRLDTFQEPLNLAVTTSDPASINLAITYAQNRGDVFVVASLPQATAGSTSDAATTAATTAAGALTASSYAAVYWPNVVVANPASSAPGATRVQSPVGAMLGILALTDATRGVQKAPAGPSTRIAGALAPEVFLSSANLDTLNVAQVNAIRALPGNGVVVMGARTLKQGASDRYVPIRRTLIYIKTNVLTLSQYAVFEDNTPTLRDSLSDTIEGFLNEAWQRGVLKGASASDAYYVICDGTNNTPTTISQGIVNVEVGVSPITPAEFIVIQVGQFEGGSTAVEV